MASVTPLISQEEKISKRSVGKAFIALTPLKTLIALAVASRLTTRSQTLARVVFGTSSLLKIT